MNRRIMNKVVDTIGPIACELVEGERVRVSPDSTERCAALLGLCYDEGWQVTTEGRGGWQSDEAPGTVVVSLKALDQLLDVRPEEHLVAAHAGTRMDRLHRGALEQGSWLPLDPPGSPARSIGSVVATGTGGPLRQLVGSVHDQVLALTVVTGDGRVLRTSDGQQQGAQRPDTLGMHVGGFGGFGIITECRMRLHDLTRADVTWIAIADRDRLTQAARTLMQLQLDPAAVELMSPALANEQEWLLAVRFVGDVDEVAEAGAALAQVHDVSWEALTDDQQQLLWSSSARAMSSLPITFRLGGLVEGLDDTLDLVVARLGESLLSAGAASGTLRWSGEAEAKSLRLLRATLAAREIPLTLERAPWHLLRAVGHFGAYREGLNGLVSRLRERYDPKGVLLSALGSEETA